MKGLRGSVRNSLSDASLLSASAALLWSIRVGLWLMPFARVQRLLARLARPAPAKQDARQSSPERIAWALEAVSPFVPGASCLPRALAAQALLARHGQASDLKIGVARDANGRFAAHAWVECGGQTVIGGSPGPGRYAPLQALSPSNNRPQE